MFAVLCCLLGANVRVRRALLSYLYTLSLQLLEVLNEQINDDDDDDDDELTYQRQSNLSRIEAESEIES